MSSEYRWRMVASGSAESRNVDCEAILLYNGLPRPIYPPISLLSRYNSSGDALYMFIVLYSSPCSKVVRVLIHRLSCELVIGSW